MFAKKKSVFLFIIITLMALAVRYIGRDIISADMIIAFLPWFKTMKECGGLASLSSNVGDYSLLYQTMVALLTYIDADPVYLYKTVSVIFDFLIAVSIAFFLCNCGTETVFKGQNKEMLFWSAYAAVLFLPTVFMNSAFWGQCDSIYTFFLLWSIWFLYKENFPLSFFMLGWALAFKLQPILLFPLYVYYYFSKKKFSLLNILITACTFWFSGIIVYISRWNTFESVGVYSNQVVMFKQMWMNVPSFWILIGDDYDKLHLFAIGLTFLILGTGLVLVLTGRQHMDSFEQIIALAVFVEWTCIVFLPAMHERYTYVMDLLLLMLAFINKKNFKFAFIAIGTSCITYCSYLFTKKELNLPIVILYIFVWFLYTYSLFSINIHQSDKPTDNVVI